MTTFKLFMPDRLLDHETASARDPVMVRDPLAADHSQLQDVLDALDDPECRTIIKHMEKPMTAKAISNSCDIPLSTTYRKLELLTNASLVQEQTEVRISGRHTARYALDFEEVHVALNGDRSLEVAIEHPERKPDQQLSELWAEVRKK